VHLRMEGRVGEEPDEFANPTGLKAIPRPCLARRQRETKMTGIFAGPACGSVDAVAGGAGWRLDAI
jgi:hypothetical protein